MANKITDFRLILPTRAESINISELSDEERESLQIVENLDQRNIYRYSVGIDYGLNLRRRVRSKYNWNSGVDCIYFAAELTTRGCQFVRGIFPRRLESSQEPELEYSLEAGIDKYAKAKVAGKIYRDKNNKYNRIKFASRSDRQAFWVIDKRWIIEHNLSYFQVVCALPNNILTSTSKCVVCALRKNGEDIQTRRREIVLA